MLFFSIALIQEPAIRTKVVRQLLHYDGTYLAHAYENLREFIGDVEDELVTALAGQLIDSGRTESDRWSAAEALGEMRSYKALEALMGIRDGMTRLASHIAKVTLDHIFRTARYRRQPLFILAPQAIVDQSVSGEGPSVYRELIRQGDAIGRRQAAWEIGIVGAARRM